MADLDYFGHSASAGSWSSATFVRADWPTRMAMEIAILLASPAVASSYRSYTPD